MRVCSISTVSIVTFTGIHLAEFLGQDSPDPHLESRGDTSARALTRRQIAGPAKIDRSNCGRYCGIGCTELQPILQIHRRTLHHGESPTRLQRNPVTEIIWRRAVSDRHRDTGFGRRCRVDVTLQCDQVTGDAQDPAGRWIRKPRNRSGATRQPRSRHPPRRRHQRPVAVQIGDGQRPRTRKLGDDTRGRPIRRGTAVVLPPNHPIPGI